MALLRYLGMASMVAGVAFAACSEEGGETDPPDPTTSTGTTTSTGSGGGTSSSSSTGGSGGDEWLTCNVPYTNIEGECDLLNQDCDPGQWCDVAGSDGNATLICKPHFGGLKGAGDTCDATSECGVGMRCIEQACSPFCCPETDEPCAGGTCDVHMSVGGGQFVMFCSYNETCDLFTDGCDGDEVDCHLIDPDTGLAVCDMRSSNWAEEGEPCFYRNDCGDSQFCHKGPPDEDPDAGVDGRCRYLCLTPDWQNLQPGFGGCPQTPDPQTCHDAGASAMPDLGVCIPD